jgi:hypothetical protein
MLWSAYPPDMVYPNPSHFSGTPPHYPELSEAKEWLSTHPVPALVSGHYPYILRSLLPPSTMVVTILRDPVNRSVSMLRRVRRRNPKFGAMTFEEVFEDNGFRASMIENYQTKIFGIRSAGELASVNLPLRMDQGRLETALDHLEHCDVVGVTDDFESVVGKIAALGIPVGRPILTNRTPETDHEPLSEALRERILSAVELDMNLYERARGLAIA